MNNGTDATTPTPDNIECPTCKHPWPAHGYGETCIGNRNLCGCTGKVQSENKGEIEQLLDEFGKQYDMPFKFMPLTDKTPFEQMPLARKQLITEFAAKFQSYAENLARKKVVEELERLRHRLNDRYGTVMNDNSFLTNTGTEPVPRMPNLTQGGERNDIHRNN